MGRRGVAVAIVGFSAFCATAIANITRMDLAASPDTIAMVTSGVSVGVGMTQLQNTSGTSQQIQAMSVDCAGFATTTSPALPTTLANGSALQINATSNLATPLIRRCEYTITNAAVPAVKFTELQVYNGGSTLVASPGSGDLGSGSAGTPSTRTFTISRTSGTSGAKMVYAYITDAYDDFFKISSCHGGTPDLTLGCTYAIPAGTAISESVDVQCNPAGVGSSGVQHLYVVDSDGGYADVALTCSSANGTVAPILAVDPPSVSVTAPINGSGSASVMFQNNGDAALDLTGATFTGTTGELTLIWSDPACPNCTIPAHGTTALDVQFNPVGAAGTRMAQLAVAHTGSGANPMPLPITATATTGTTGTNPEIAVIADPTVFTLSTADAAQTLPVSIKNTGSAAMQLTVSAISNPSGDPGFETLLDSSCVPPGCSIPAGSSAAFDVRYTPTITGTFHATVTITSNAGMQPVYALGLDATVAPGKRTLAIQNATLPFDFGDVPVGTTGTPIAFTLKNTGDVAAQAISIGAMASGTTTYHVDQPATMLAPGATETVTLTCKPVDAGGHGDGLEIIATDVDGNAFDVAPSGLVGLACNGIQSSFAMTPSLVDYKEVRTGTAIAPVDIALTTAASSLAITDGPRLATGGGNLSLSGNLPTTIGAGSDGHVMMFVDTSHDGSLADKVVATASDGSMASVTVKGVVTTPNATPPPTAIDLGTFCLGRPTAAQDATYRSTGTATLHVGKPHLASPSSPFTLVYTAPPEAQYAPQYDLPAGSAQVVTVTANAETATGDYADTLEWTSDMPGQETLATTLAVHFVDSGGALSPQTVTFQDPVAVHLMSAPRTITLENCGSADLALMPATIAPADAFHTASALPATLAPGAKATLDVTFAPVKVGPAMATLTVDSSAGTLTAELQGVGVAGADTGGDKTGFYACGCRTTDPAAGGPIVLVAWALSRRRRRQRPIG